MLVVCEAWTAVFGKFTSQRSQKLAGPSFFKEGRGSFQPQLDSFWCGVALRLPISVAKVLLEQALGGHRTNDP
jgi:hypothetical protein